MPKRGGNISLTSYDDIFETDESRAESQLERVQNISISELVPFKDHPFKVVDDEAMLRTTESIAQFQNIREGISTTISNIYNTIKSGFDQAVGYVTGLASQAFTWGKDIIDGIVNGIKSAIGRVKDAVSNVASTIRSYLHFSVPDVGPLTDYESWMPDFMEGLAKGIEQSRHLVEKAVSSVANDMVISPKMAALQLAGGGSVAGNSVSSIIYLFRGKLRCLDCGKNYRRKMVRRGPAWVCATYNAKGKEYCPTSKVIPEDTLMEVTARVLGLEAFDESTFLDHIDCIEVGSDNQLTYIFKDGHTVNTMWQDRSRRESWTTEMREAARQIAFQQEPKERHPDGRFKKADSNCISTCSDRETA